MGTFETFENTIIGLAWLPLFPDIVSERIPERTTATKSLTEFLSQRSQETLLFQISPSAGDLIFKHLRVRKMLEDSNDIRKSLVQAQHI